MADILIGNVRGPQGETGATGAQGEQGDAATIAVGSTTTVPYGQAARVTNSGTAQEAVFDFVIPQGRPGEQVTKIDNLTIDAITEPSTQFPVPAVGDNGSTLFGKISKWFSDMAALVASKFDASNVVNNLTTTSSGYALDARQGKALDDTKLNIANVVNNLITTTEGNALDARQGKALNDALASLSSNVVRDATPYFMHDLWYTANFAVNEIALLLCYSISGGIPANAYIGMVTIADSGQTSKIFDIYGNKASLGLSFNWNSTTSLGINIDSTHWAYVGVLHVGKNKRG